MIRTEELFSGKEPGSSARVDEVLAVFTPDALDDIAGHLNFVEAEAFALLALYQGGKKNQELAQRIMLAWADADDDAEQFVERLDAWGIYPEHGFDEPWSID